MSVEAFQHDVTEIAEQLTADADAFAGRTIVISGAGGFLGRYYVAVLAELNRNHLSEPCRVVGLDNSITSEPTAVELPGVRFIQHDVIQPFTWEDPVDLVIHGAGIASPFYYRAYPLETIDVSIEGTKNLLELASAHGARMIFMSSSEIYGDPSPDQVPTPETYRGNVATLGPRACYDEGKRVGETLCYVYTQTRNASVSIVRPFNVYGPGMAENDYRVLPNFASCIAGNQPLRIYGDGRQTRTYCYVTDAIVGFFKALLHGGPAEAYNIGNPNPELSVIELADTIERVIGREVPIELAEYPDTYPADEPLRRCPDITKAREQLGYEPSVVLEEGLGRFFRWTEGVYTGTQ